MKEILRGSFVIVLFKVLGAISLFSTYILIPRYYGVKMFGVFNLIFALMMIGSVVARIGLDTYLLRVISSLDNNKREISLFIKESFKIILIGSFMVILLIFLFIDTINSYLFKSMDAYYYLIGLMVIMVPYTIFNVLPEIFRALDDIKLYAFFRNFSQNFTIFFLILFNVVTTLMYDPIYTLYTSIIIITIMLIISLYSFLKKQKINPFIRGKYRNKIIKHSYPMLLAASIMFLMGYIDSFMISYYLNEYQVGIYNACISLSLMITFIPTAIGGFISPKVSSAYTRNESLEVKKIFYNSLKIIILFTIPIFFVLLFYADFFLGLFGKEFEIATTTLLIVNVAFLSEALCGPVGFILNMTDNQHVFMKILSISLLINALFNALLIPLYGINGAAIAMMLSMFFWTIGSLVILKRKKII
jgi:O-antigen/teichoic acid export membrane protein